MPKLQIYAAPHDDIAQGFVWLKKDDLPQRGIVKIRQGGNGRAVFCEALQLDKNFMELYNECPRRARIDHPESSIVMSQWYRAKIGGEAPLETHKEYLLEVESSNTRWGKMRACMQHPQVVVRVAVRLGVWSLGLGILSVILGLVALGHSTGLRADVQHSGSAALPTASEVFNLRSKCANLGDKVSNDYRKDNPGQLGHWSHYDPGTNRCYVELDTMLYGRVGGYISFRILYDGQTSVMLARVTDVKPAGTVPGKVSGFLNGDWQSLAQSVGMDLQKGRWENGNLGMQPASDQNIGFLDDLINKAMADDYKR